MSCGALGSRLVPVRSGDALFAVALLRDRPDVAARAAAVVVGFRRRVAGVRQADDPRRMAVRAAGRLRRYLRHGLLDAGCSLADTGTAASRMSGGRFACI